MRQIPAHFWRGLNALRDTQPFLWLYTIETGSDDEALHLVKNPEPITWNGATYKPWPISIGEISESGEGEVVSTTLTIANIGGIVTTYLEAASLRQAQVTTIIVYARDMVLTESVRFRWAIRAAKETPPAVAIQLGLPDFYELPFPRRRFIRANGFPNIPKRLR